MMSAPDLPAKNFTAMLRLDHNRALSQLAAKAGVAVGDIEKLVVWSNHSPTMYPDYRFATAKGESLKEKINDAAWNADRSEEHTSELQSLMRISYAVFCLKTKRYKQNQTDV